MSSIVVESLGRSFGDVVAVQSLSFTVEPGEVVGLLGANGAGKTTTMRMVLGLLSPDAGVALIGDTPAADVDRRIIGYVPQGLGLYGELTVAENIAFSSGAFGVDVPPLGDDLVPFADRKISTVSLGVRRRVAFLAARCHDPQVLVLDEPTSGVGPLGRARLWDTIHNTAEQGAAVLVSTHYMDEAEECDRVVLMAHGGEVASGPVKEVIGGAKSVAITGSLSDESVEAITEAGGYVLLDGRGWRVVGLGVDQVQPLAPDATVSEVPATFEEAFVALST